MSQISEFVEAPFLAIARNGIVEGCSCDFYKGMNETASLMATFLDSFGRAHPQDQELIGTIGQIVLAIAAVSEERMKNAGAIENENI